MKDPTWKHERKSRQVAVLEAGVLAGLAGGGLMGLLAMIHAAVIGTGFWLPMKLVAGVWFGAGAVTGGAGVVLAGLATHLAVSIAWGLLFALLVRRTLDYVPALLVGLAYGAGIWVLMSYGVLPWANEAMFSRVEPVMSWFFGYHLLYGAGVALGPVLTRAFFRRQRPEAYGGTIGGPAHA